jgi:hypothetical protein
MTLEAVGTIVLSAGVGAGVGLLTRYFAHRYWFRQETWKLRGDAWHQLFAAVSAFRRLLVSPPKGIDLAELEERIADSWGEFFAAGSMCRAFMSAEAVAVLDQFNEEAGKLFEEKGATHKEFREFVNEFADSVLPRAARKDLDVDPSWWWQRLGSDSATKPAKVTKR